MNTLTITAHACSDTFFQPAILATIAVNPQDVALLIFGARSILNFLLNGPSEKSLKEAKKRLLEHIYRERRSLPAQMLDSYVASFKLYTT